MIKTPKWQPIPKMAGYLTTTYGMNFKVTELTVVTFSVQKLLIKMIIMKNWEEHTQNVTNFSHHFVTVIKRPILQCHPRFSNFSFWVYLWSKSRVFTLLKIIMCNYTVPKYQSIINL